MLVLVGMVVILSYGICWLIKLIAGRSVETRSGDGGMLVGDGV